MSRASITGWGKYLPDNILTNKDLEEMVETNDEWIRSRTGIKQRYIAADDETTADLAYHAARKALSKADLKAEKIDMIIVATVTPDMPFPATSCILEDRLGAANAATFDLEAGCSGFVYGLSVASQFIESGMYDNILVVGAETLSKIMDWEDRNTCVLFGDGAGAAVVQSVNDGGFMSFDLGSDGSGGDSLYMPGGGSLNPATEKTIKDRLHYIKMEGNQVFKFAVKRMSQSSLDVVNKAGFEAEDVDLFIPHQANTRIINSAAKRLNLDNDEVYVNLPEYGNTSSASVPIAMAEARNKGLIKNGDKVVLVAFGAGLTWASAFLEWNEEGK